MVNLTAAKLLYDQAGLAPWTASRDAWGRSLGDGIGWERPRMTAGSARAGSARSASAPPGAGISIANTVNVQARGHDPKRVVAIVDRRLDEFAAAVEEEILSGSEEQLL